MSYAHRLVALPTKNQHISSTVPCPAPYTNNTGNPAMATAGCGDVLTGVITSLLGQGLTGWDAARLGVWIHGRAGDVAAARTSQAGMTAQHLVETLASIADEMHA